MKEIINDEINVTKRSKTERNVRDCLIISAIGTKSCSIRLRSLSRKASDKRRAVRNKRHSAQLPVSRRESVRDACRIRVISRVIRTRKLGNGSLRQRTNFLQAILIWRAVDRAIDRSVDRSIESPDNRASGNAAGVKHCARGRAVQPAGN